MNNQTYFISYTTRTESDKKWATWIEYILRKVVGGKTIMQEYDFRPGENFKIHMDNALKEADVVICVLTRAYMDSVNCQEEWTNAERFIPVKCDDCKPEGLLKSRSYINLYGLDKNAARDTLVAELQEKLRPDEEPEFPAALNETALDEPTFPGFADNNLPDPNPHFTGRKDILSKIALGLKDTSTVIIKGQGGFGKTQIAVAYAYEHISTYKYIWYFNAESEMHLQEDYRAFAAYVIGLSTARTEDLVVVRGLIDIWLAKNTSYLFIYDNAEGCPNLRHYLPRGLLRGHTLINTRERLRGIIGEKLDVTRFSLMDATAFLKKRITNVDDADVEKLSNTLGGLPLALEQAAAYIHENQYTIKQYLDLLRKHGLKILNTASADTDYEHTVLTTWKITFDKLEQDKQSKPSVQLFKLLAYCAPDDIPLQMFIDGKDKLFELLRDVLDPSDEPGQNELIEKLTRYSLVSMRRDEEHGMLLSVHRLIQAVVNLRLDGDTAYLRHCLNMASDVFRYEFSTQKDFVLFALNLSHILEIANHAEAMLANDNDAKLEVAHIYNNVGMGFSHQGDYTVALEWYKKALAISEKVLGVEHPSTATTYNNIAGVYKDQGDYTVALEWYKKACRIFREKFGKTHPHTQIVIENAKSAYSRAGFAEEFEIWLSKQ